MVRTYTVFSATACAVAVVLAVAGITQSADTEPVPASPHGTLAIEQVPGFSDFPLYWLGTSFEGLPLTRIVSAAPVPPRGGPGDVPAGPGPTRAVSFTYGACRGASCTPPLRVLVRPACAVEAARPAEAARRLHVRGVPVVARGDRYILRTGSVAVTASGRDAHRRLHALERMRSANVGGGDVRPGERLPPADTSAAAWCPHIVAR